MTAAEDRGCRRELADSYIVHHGRSRDDADMARARVGFRDRELAGEELLVLVLQVQPPEGHRVLGEVGVRHYEGERRASSDRVQRSEGEFPLFRVPLEIQDAEEERSPGRRGREAAEKDNDDG